jgi:hypothetical protein
MRNERFEFDSNGQTLIGPFISRPGARQLRW